MNNGTCMFTIVIRNIIIILKEENIGFLFKIPRSGSTPTYLLLQGKYNVYLLPCTVTASRIHNMRHGIISLLVEASIMPYLNIQ